MGVITTCAIHQPDTRPDSHFSACLEVFNLPLNTYLKAPYKAKKMTKNLERAHGPVREQGDSYRNSSRPTCKDMGPWPGTTGLWARGKTSVLVWKVVSERGQGVEPWSKRVGTQTLCLPFMDYVASAPRSAQWGQAGPPPELS